MASDLIERLKLALSVADEVSRDLANGAVCTGGEIEKFDELIDAGEEAATALQSSEARAERLERENEAIRDAERLATGSMRSWKEAALDAERRLAVAGEALKPFADIIGKQGQLAIWPDDSDHWVAKDHPWGRRITVGMIRGARQALSFLGEGTNGDS